MGRGKGKGVEEPPWPERERLCETSREASRHGFDTELDCQQRRAGHRFHYRRRPRSEIRPKYDRADYSTRRALALAWIALLPIVSALFCCTTLASGPATRLTTRNVVAESVNPFITTSSVFTDGALRRGISAIILEATGSDAAPNAPSPGRLSIGLGSSIVKTASPKKALVSVLAGT
jgi:hypothetical protein